MAKFNVVDMNGQHVSEIELSDAVFGITPNEKAVHIAVVNFLANQRQGTQNTKIRMEVSGGGKKPWRQKGTGHARQGSIRAPQWTHGGVALGPKPRSYNYHINNKVKRLALLSVLSDKAANGNMVEGTMDAKGDRFEPEGWTPKFKVIEVWNKAFPKQ